MDLEFDEDKVFDQHVSNFISWVIHVAFSEEDQNDKRESAFEEEKILLKQKEETNDDCESLRGTKEHIERETSEEKAPEQERIAFFKDVRLGELNKLKQARERNQLQKFDIEGNEEFEQNVKRLPEWNTDTACGDEDTKDIFNEKALSTKVRDHTILEANNLTEIQPDKTPMTHEDNGMYYFKHVREADFTKQDIAIEQERLQIGEKVEQIEYFLSVGDTKYEFLEQKTKMLAKHYYPGETISCQKQINSMTYPRVFSPVTIVPEYLQTYRLTLFERMYPEWAFAHRSWSMSTLCQTESVVSIIGSGGNPLSPERTKSEHVVKKKKSVRFLIEKVYKTRISKRNIDSQELHLDLTSFADESGFEDISLNDDMESSTTPLHSDTCSDWYNADLEEFEEIPRPTLKPFFTEEYYYPLVKHVFQDLPTTDQVQHLQSDRSVDDKDVLSNTKSRNPFRRMLRWICKRCVCGRDKNQN